MPAAPARTRQELLQAAGLLFERNAVTAATGRHALIKKAQQQRLLTGNDTSYILCIKNHYRGPNAMTRLWEDVLRWARAGGLQMSDSAQSRLTEVLAGDRPELSEIRALLNAAAAAEGEERTAALRAAVHALARRSENGPPVRVLGARTRSMAASMPLDTAVLGWISIFDACLAPETADPGAPVPPDRAAVALEALDRGAATDAAYQRATGRGRVGFPPSYVEAASGTGTWLSARAVLAAAEHYGDPVAVARGWGVQHDLWLRPRDEGRLAAQIARTLFDHGRTADALHALELACLRQDPVPAAGLIDVAVGLCTALLALGDRESADRAIPPVIRALLDNPDLISRGREFDESLSEGLRQALVDPRLGLPALRRVWFAAYCDEPADSSTGWLVAGALARCLWEAGTPAEARTVAVLTRRMLDEPGNEQERRMRGALVATESGEGPVALEAERQRLHTLLDELGALLLRSPHLAADPRIVRELEGIARVAKRARVLFRPERRAPADRTVPATRR